MKPHQKSSYSIRTVILISFTLVFAIVITTVGFSFTNMFTVRNRTMLSESVQAASQQETANIEGYLRDIRNVANALNYNVIKQSDISSADFSRKFSLLYSANADKINSMALFDGNGSLLAAAPKKELKPGNDVTEQDWFTSAIQETENMHFSKPHVQNLFQSTDYRYPWVISLSAAVEMNLGGGSSHGVLLIDMDYTNLEQLLENANSQMSDSYSYLLAENGDIIYHPRQNQIHYGIYAEKIPVIAADQEGIFDDGENNRIIVIQTVSYAGWKLVSIIPSSALKAGTRNIQYLVLMMLCLSIGVTLIINRALANRVSGPLIRLNDSISNMEGVRNIPPSIYEHSSREVNELGITIHSYVDQINRLMDEMIAEEEEKRKAELDALQAQINPHFLYNTLDSIIWMIEGGKYSEAENMITDLASFFRMSLNHGKSMISIGNELQQAKAYLAIQKIRYKHSFTDSYEIEENIEKYMTVKLTLQPILENAIYHGIKEAEQDGEIHIHAWKVQNDIYIAVSDNGYGMNEEEVQNILDETKRPAVEKHGSGVGLINVDKRLRLRFGEKYGLQVESEPDEGTTVTIHIPAIEATEENLALYENGKVEKKV